MGSPFWERVCSKAISLDHLELYCNLFCPSFAPKSPPLRHLTIHAESNILDNVGISISRVQQTLETLFLSRFAIVEHPNFLPVNRTFIKLTHVYPATLPRDSIDLQAFQSFLGSIPSLRYFRWDNPGCGEPSLPLLIPYLSTTVTQIDTLCWSGDPLPRIIESIVEACARHLKPLQYRIRIYVEVVLPDEIIEPIVSEALSRGVRIEVLDVEFYAQVPPPLEIWQEEWG